MEDWEMKKYRRGKREIRRQCESNRRWAIAVLIMVAVLLMLPAVGDVLYGVFH